MNQETGDMSADELFKNHYDDYHGADEMSDEMITDGANVVALWHKDETSIGGLDPEQFTVENFEVTVEEWSSKESDETVEVYELLAEDTQVFLTKELVDEFLGLYDLTIEDVTLYEGTYEFPVIVELDDKEWNGIIAPRIAPSEKRKV